MKLFRQRMVWSWLQSQMPSHSDFLIFSSDVESQCFLKICNKAAPIGHFNRPTICGILWADRWRTIFKRFGGIQTAESQEDLQLLFCQVTCSGRVVAEVKHGMLSTVMLVWQEEETLQKVLFVCKLSQFGLLACSEQRMLLRTSAWMNIYTYAGEGILHVCLIDTSSLGR